jgi:hypothetical protein
MADLILATKLGEAMRIAIDIRDGEVPVPHAAGPRLVDALNACLEHVAHDELTAAGLSINSMNYLELLDWLGPSHLQHPCGGS